MQREIKFRGKPVPGELWNINSPPEWIYGFPYSEDGINITHLVTHMPNWELVSGAPDNHNWWVKVLPESVGQYTGLKDIIGTDIYEDDIVQYSNSMENGKAIVKYQSCTFVFDWFEQNTSSPSIIAESMSYFQCSAELKIIGNTIDNPELIKP